jgi:DNA-binding NarL/FixJ family response regulator
MRSDADANEAVSVARTAPAEMADLSVVSRRRGSPERVLIVDDHVLFAEGLEAALRGSGIEVVGIATLAREATTLVRRERPDFVLINVDVPSMDGIGVGRRILAEFPEITLIAVTGLHDAGLVSEAIRAGFQGFVMKESSIDELIASMQAIAGSLAVIPHEAAKALAGMHSERQRADLLSSHLTEREREVLSWLADGASSAELAAGLHLSGNTVRTHIQNICFKLQVHSRLEAVTFAYRHGIVTGGRTTARGDANGAGSRSADHGERPDQLRAPTASTMAPGGAA